MTQEPLNPPDQSRRERTYHWPDPTPGLQAAPRLTGLEYLRGMARGEYPSPPIGHTLDFRLAHEDDIQPGQVTFRFTPQEFHYNPLGGVHGGVFATLLDSALGCAIHTQLPAGVGYTTLELSVNYLRPLHAGMGEVRAVGEVVSITRQVATARASLLDARDRLCATATTTCLILRPEVQP